MLLDEGEGGHGCAVCVYLLLPLQARLLRGPWSARGLLCPCRCQLWRPRAHWLRDCKNIPRLGLGIPRWGEWLSAGYYQNDKYVEEILSVKEKGQKLKVDVENIEKELDSVEKELLAKAATKDDILHVFFQSELEKKCATHSTERNIVQSNNYINTITGMRLLSSDTDTQRLEKVCVENSTIFG